MNRKEFITTLTKAALLPLILPSCTWQGRSEQQIKHVVFCLIGGGLRNFETTLKREGNLMPNLIAGNESISSDILSGIESMPRLFEKPLSEQGSFYSNFRYNSDETIHYSAHAAAITGNYKGNFQIMKPLEVPTIFEYFRKHKSASTSALNTWWVCDQGGPFPFLNYSNHKDYGPLYGANMINPSSLFNLDFSRIDFFDNNTLKQIDDYKKMLLDLDLVHNPFPHERGIVNNDEDRYRIQNFVKNLGSNYFNKPNHDFWGLGDLVNDDIKNMFVACEVLKEFEPELMVVNMQDSDIGHSQFTSMCNNIGKADFALAKLWETIQTIPNMKDNTVLIAAPEFGRNLNSNTIMDSFGRMAVDHTGDANSKEIFCLLLGPKHVIRQNNLLETTDAETIDILPTIASILGFDKHIPSELIEGKILKDALA